MQRDRPQQPRDGAGREPPRPPRPRPCAPGAPAQPPLPAAGGGTDSRLPNPVSHWYEHRAGNVTRPAATSLPPGCTGRSCRAAARWQEAAPGTPGSGRRGPCPSSPGQPPAPARAARQDPPAGGRTGCRCPREGDALLSRAPGRGAVRACVCVPACACVSPRVSPRVPACAPCLHAVPACVALQRAGCAACAGSAAAPAPRAGPPRHRHPLSEPGWRVSLRYYRRES